MIGEAELRELIREYCHTELKRAKDELVGRSVQFRKTLSEIKNTGNYELLRDALRYLYSGKYALKYFFKTTADLEILWENFLKEVVETPPEELLENIDERFERWRQINGAGRGIISESLAFYYPDYFVPWNNTVNWYFRELGWGRPTKYSEVLSRFRKLKRLFKEECANQDINFVLVDYFGWWLRNRRNNSSKGKNRKNNSSNRKTHDSDTTVTKLGEYLASKGYLYPSYLVAQFYTALKTKGFVILSGLTGTGKTKIAQELAELLDDSGKNFLFLSVRPDWRDSKALLGYYNPLTGEYHRTELLEFILEAKEYYEQKRRNARPYFVLLDEMNLAHVEYYFADFLSVLESGRDEEGFTREPLRLHDVDKVEEEGIPKEIYLPPNLYIIGTVNMDETTYAFSPKVLDRAFVVEFHDVDLEKYPPETYEPASEAIESLKQTVLRDLKGPDKKFLARSKDELNEAVRELKDEHPDYWKTLVTLNKALEPYDMHFGYRVVDEVALFFKSAKESKEAGIVEFENYDEIFDLAILMKVLPKFHGNRKKLENPLKEALKLCLVEGSGLNVDELRSADIVKILEEWENQKTNFRFKHTSKKVLRMLRQLHEIGFASFS
ncbi:McrB family protein [Thermococcus zilligii]|uniref:McrB family protein n=1 Tax=Thermococcus zilligii TaxID=54076 RepID=UPI000299E4DE|nr:AAA family ATPase [Thermococcus zilligii]